MHIRHASLTLVAAAAVLAGCASAPGNRDHGYARDYGPSSSRRCHDCGTVIAIERASARNSNVAGPVLGGIVGAVAAKELARRNTDSDGRRNAAIAAGAAGGAIAGNAIQNRRQGQALYNVHVRMDDGRTTVLGQSDLDGIHEGDYVRVQNGRAWRY